MYVLSGVCRNSAMAGGLEIQGQSPSLTRIFGAEPPEGENKHIKSIGVARIFAGDALYCFLKCWRPFLVAILLTPWNTP